MAVLGEKGIKEGLFWRFETFQVVANEIPRIGFFA
jgi:hypothetical protein